MKRKIIGFCCLIGLLTSSACITSYARKTDGEQQVSITMTVEEIRELFQIANMRDVTRPNSFITNNGVKIIINRD